MLKGIELDKPIPNAKSILEKTENLNKYTERLQNLTSEKLKLQDELSLAEKNQPTNRKRPRRSIQGNAN